MKRTINLKNYSFKKWLDVPFFTDDTNAYELVYNLGDKGKGGYFKVTATRADGVSITDIGDVSENGVISYTLAGNMYGVVGELVLRVQVLNGDTALTEKIIHATVVKGESGTENPSTVQPFINSLVEQIADNKAKTEALENDKVDKEDGKGLSTNDFTNQEKEKLAKLKNYELPDDVVQDANYVHTDNNYTTEEKKKLQKITFDNVSNALKGTTNGGAISITDISPVEHNMAVEIKRKNLIKFPSVDLNYRSGYEKTTNGVTFTVNDDGSVYARGSAATNDAYFNLCKLNLNTNRTYIMSGGENGTTYAAVNLSISKRVTYQEDSSLVYIHIPKGTVIDEVLYPQIEYGTILTPFAPYIEDISKVKLYKQGKNLIKFPDNRQGNVNYFYVPGQVHNQSGITFTVQDDGGIYTKGTATADAFFNIGKDNYFGDWVPTEKMIEGGSNGTTRDGYSISERLTWQSEYRRFYLCIPSGVTINKVLYPQFEISPQPTKHEPYIEPTIYDVPSNGIVEGVTSLYPNTTLYIDTSGAVIDCTYNRDINKAFAELQAMILEG